MGIVSCLIGLFFGWLINIWIELIPAGADARSLGLFWQRKKSGQQLLVSLLNGLLYWLMYAYFGLTWLMVTGWVLTSLLIMVTWIDLAHYIIPNEIVFVAMFLSIPLNWLSQQLDWTQMVVGMLMGGGSLMFIALISRGGMGGGDIKLMAAMGLYLGWQQVLLAIFLAALLGAVIGLGLIFLGKKGRKDAIPFGPFLAIGTLMAWLWSQEIIHWYWNIGLTR